ncbi:hypothetical protein VD0002_g1190 [Verticillium dahliae]|uniref:Ubiquitin carboxyl-terminal hydrolase n=2 Tax=Verticillium dahliae TaxID=27337 RepID=G2XCH5_VERDV|nr:uncharacterized protein VDAG_07857 [Verticillium dahliae VdLs.17]EGY16693.1 hypothetical protein VDAG_07857 [Verticillium dahliae VdLs.17]KAH6706938.1 hypothetical protein EV126DRAFT_488406 [Verticillium dahliae]PNH31525.1 hypothetical protein BJF96_g5126 [Verticillium dahliae]PNH68998.1 hypothetical protein VD0002_g1190 [Verticillium dahliae]
MPDKQITTISYAAGASLAAIALVYVFAPSFAIDEAATSSSRKKGVVGLRNYANDCFINSTLQALAGLGDLRIYLIRETHRRYIEDPAVYAHLVQPAGQALPQWKLQNLQKGIVSQGLKDMLDALNERPIYKKSTSAADFVKVLEQAFKQRISRQQQDAQEFLQIVAERLKDEYHAGERARAHARNAVAQGTIASQPVDGVAIQERLEGLAAAATVATAADPNSSGSATGTDSSANPTPPTIQTNGVVPNALQDEDEGFPMEGQHESQLECQTCGHKSAPKTETFVTLTLRVPQVRSTTLSSCFDEIFKTEYIDDFKCEKCRLVHAEEMLKKEIEKSSSDSFRHAKTEELKKLQHAIAFDPDDVPDDVTLPDSRYAPKRRIARSARITKFPKVLTIHLSRSIYETQASTKNSAKVSFPESLPLGGLTDRRRYKLIALVTHKGSHHSGHYESFRRQTIVHAPYPNLNTFQPAGIYSKSASPSSTPRLHALSRGDSPAVSTPDLPLTANSSTHSLASDASPSRPRSLRQRLSPTSAPRGGDDANGSPHRERERDDTASLRSVAASTRSALSRISLSRDRGGGSGSGTVSVSDTATPVDGATPMAVPPAPRPHRKRKTPDRWWRISDEKIREAKTGEVLGMQREVYLLFYELDKDDDGGGGGDAC